MNVEPVDSIERVSEPRSSKLGSFVGNSLQLDQQNVSIRSLSTAPDEKLVSVPPPTPTSNISFEYGFAPMSGDLHKLQDWEPPYVREVGVKRCIDILAEHFGCKDYKINPVQFWFLDIIADVLWRMQDEFHFSVLQQRVVLGWVLYIFDLIRAPQMNYSRKKVFRVVSEALHLAEEHLDAVDTFPLPYELFDLKVDQESAHSVSLSGTESDSSSEEDSSESGSSTFSYVAIPGEDGHTFFRLPKRGHSEEKLSSSSSDESETSESSNEELEEASPIQDEINEETKVEDNDLSYMSMSDFYKPDPNVPLRFLESSSSSSYISDYNDENLNDEEDSIGDMGNNLKRDITWRSSSRIVDSSSTSCPNDAASGMTGEQSDKIYPGSPKQSTNKVKSASKTNQFEDTSVEALKNDILKYFELRKVAMKEEEKSKSLNLCILQAIKLFIFDYFYESFQFVLLKMAFIGTHTVITQNVNDIWNVPKILREELKRPKVKKPKAPKKPKKKKEKKAKSKKSKKSSSKKSKKGSKKGKKEKKGKKKKLTKEEKAELKRLKMEAMRLEEEKRLEELNRRTLNPLKDAVDDEFFKEMFPGFAKKTKGKKNKKKKGKK